MPLTLSVWPVAVSVVSPVVRTAVIGRVFVSCVVPPVSVAVPVIALFCVSVIALVPAATVSAPVSVSTPVCVTAPVAVMLALPTPSVPRVVAAALVVSRPELAPLTLSVWPVAVSVVAPVVRTAVVGRVFVSCVVPPVSVAVPVIALFCVSVIALAPAATVSAPASVSTPVCVTGPEAVMLALPTPSVPRLVATAFVFSAPVTEPEIANAPPA